MGKLTARQRGIRETCGTPESKWLWKNKRKVWAGAKKGYSMSEMARMSGASRSSVRRVLRESPDWPFRYGTIYSIPDELGIKAKELRDQGYSCDDIVEKLGLRNRQQVSYLFVR